MNLMKSCISIVGLLLLLNACKFSSTEDSGLKKYEGSGAAICADLQSDSERAFQEKKFTDKAGAEQYFRNLVSEEISSVRGSLESCNLKLQNLRAAQTTAPETGAGQGDGAAATQPAPGNQNQVAAQPGAAQPGAADPAASNTIPSTGSDATLGSQGAGFQLQNQGIGCEGETIQAVEARKATYEAAQQKLATAACKIEFTGALAGLVSSAAVAATAADDKNKVAALKQIDDSKCDTGLARELGTDLNIDPITGETTTNPLSGLDGFNLDRSVGSAEKTYKSGKITQSLNTGVAGGGVSFSVQEAITYAADFEVDSSKLDKGVDPKTIRCLGQVDARTQAQYQYAGYAKCSVTVTHTVGQEAFASIAVGIGIANSEVSGAFGQETEFRAEVNNNDTYTSNATFRIAINQPESKVDSICKSWVASAVPSLKEDLKAKVQSKLARLLRANSCVKDSECQSVYTGAAYIGRCVSNGKVGACKKRATGRVTQGNYWWGTSCKGNFDVPCDSKGGYYCKQVAVKDGSGLRAPWSDENFYDFTKKRYICVNKNWADGPFSQRILN